MSHSPLFTVLMPMLGAMGVFSGAFAIYCLDINEARRLGKMAAIFSGFALVATAALLALRVQTSR
jgi:hypothetical protein